jgi:hypothetical protein
MPNADGYHTRPTRPGVTLRCTHGGEAEQAGEKSRVGIDLRPMEMGCEPTITHLR